MSFVGKSFIGNSPDVVKDGSITAAKLAPNSVTTVKIQDGAVTPAKTTFIEGGGAILMNDTTVTVTVTEADWGAGRNGLSVGPMTVANGVTVTVAPGKRWVVL